MKFSKKFWATSGIVLIVIFLITLAFFVWSLAFRLAIVDAAVSIVLMVFEFLVISSVEKRLERMRIHASI